MAAAVASPPSTPLVRVEDSTSIGRAYSSAQQRSVPGLGARRAALTTRSLVPPPEGSVLESLTMRSVHLARASREEVLAYFRNTWELTETLFAALASDAVFYMVPDTLRRPLIFYFGHPAALYINKGHQAGLVGESPLAGVPPGVPRARGGGGGGGGARPRPPPPRAPRLASARSHELTDATHPLPPPPCPARPQTSSTRTSASSSRRAWTR